MNIQHFDRALLFMHIEEINLLAPFFFLRSCIHYNMQATAGKLMVQFFKKYIFGGALQAFPFFLFLSHIHSVACRGARPHQKEGIPEGPGGLA